MSRSVVALLAALVFPGCIYANVKAPLSYRAPTPADVGGKLGREVTGEACNYSVLALVAWGDGSYAAAVAQARQSAGVQLIADVKADVRFFNILGVYQESCTRVTGRAVE